MSRPSLARGGSDDPSGLVLERIANALKVDLMDLLEHKRSAGAREGLQTVSAMLSFQRQSGVRFVGQSGTAGFRVKIADSCPNPDSFHSVRKPHLAVSFAPKSLRERGRWWRRSGSRIVLFGHL